MTTEDLKDKQKGMIVGLLVGDALGCPNEFKARDSFPPVTGYTTGSHSVPPGTWTDDGAMALALCHSLKGGFNLADQLDHYVRWREGDRLYNPCGCFDIGGQTSAALGGWRREGVLWHSFQTGSSGNGSIMRLSPVVARYLDLTSYPDLPMEGWYALADFCGLSSITTHPNAECVTACRILGVLTAALAWNVCRDNPAAAGQGIVADVALLGYPGADPKAAKVWTSQEFLTKERRNIRSTGYVLDTLEAALWAFYRTSTFRECVIAAANLGHDSDTVGAVAGQLAGAFYGYAGIDQDLKDGLAAPELVEKALDGLF